MTPTSDLTRCPRGVIAGKNVARSRCHRISEGFSRMTLTLRNRSVPSTTRSCRDLVDCRRGRSAVDRGDRLSASRGMGTLASSNLPGAGHGRGLISLRQGRHRNVGSARNTDFLCYRNGHDCLCDRIHVWAMIGKMAVRAVARACAAEQVGRGARQDLSTLGERAFVHPIHQPIASCRVTFRRLSRPALELNFS